MSPGNDDPSRLKTGSPVDSEQRRRSQDDARQRSTVKWATQLIRSLANADAGIEKYKMVR